MATTGENVTIDISATTALFAAAIEGVGRSITELVKPLIAAFEEVGRAISGMFVRLQPLARMLVIAKYGADNETGGGVWQSNMCATWLHDSCQAHGFCDCGCHR